MKPTNAEGPLTDLTLTAEFDGVGGSQVALSDPDVDGVYVGTMTAAAAGAHDMLITITNTVTAGVTVIRHPYLTVAP